MSTEYKAMVKALVKPGKAILAELNPHKAEAIHMAMGISGEVVELCDSTTIANFLEEAGDIFFFVEGMYQLVEPLANGADGTFKLDVAALKDTTRMVSYSGEILDKVKKYAIYGKELDVTGLLSDLAHLTGILMTALTEAGVTAEQAKQLNMDKLAVRYSSGSYSNEQAKARADKELH